MVLKISTLFLALCLTLVIVQDIRKRTIHLILPILILASGLILNYYTMMLNFENMFYNICFLVINVIGLILYYSIKGKAVVNPVDKFIGLGDILFFVSITPLFNIKPFVLFFISGLIFSLILYGVLNIFKKVETVPLAGYFSLFLLSNLMMKHVFNVNLLI